jgi:hypothetical protein
MSLHSIARSNPTRSGNDLRWRRHCKLPLWRRSSDGLRRNLSRRWGHSFLLHGATLEHTIPIDLRVRDPQARHQNDGGDQLL